MDMRSVEKKWQEKWEKAGMYRFDRKDADKKFYVLEMFSYPSAAKLHLGHWYNYAPADSYARFKRMQGYAVFQPMGFDAFGLPAENYAIKTGVHPKDSTEQNIANMEKTLREMGASFDWSAELKTCDPAYYKWTQWMFLQLYKHNLAYRKEALVNWCPSCETVLANEQVVNGLCERCKSPVSRRNMTQWFFKITDYAEELLSGLDTIDWPEKTKQMQRNWIGKSTGCEIIFNADNADKDEIRVFTTRCDTVFGVNYVVLAPEHPLLRKLTTEENRQAVEEYIAYAAKANDIDRLSTSREKTGVFTGSYAVNPVNGKRIPVYTADYVLYSYGTGAVMAVSAHDERDFEFAKKYNLPVTQVLRAKKGETVLPYTDNGVLVNSGKFDGLYGEEAREAIAAYLTEIGKGSKKINYRLRDWSVSRQRYWGAPIPVIYCPDCGAVPVPEEDLPVELPYDVEFRPTGKSPLASHEGFMNCKCPRCGKAARRDPDTLDTFVCSSWYYLRYPDAHNQNAPFDGAFIDKMLPVDTYIGGAEHACMHLLYARFFTKALRDMGYLHFDEPFKRLVHQGGILGTDGSRMSKSKGNVVSPDDYVKEYGADTFRLYLMFAFSYTEGGPWNDDGIRSISKFMERVERIVEKAATMPASEGKNGEEEKELEYARNYAIKQVSRDFEAFSFNTAVARLMELTNALYKYDGCKEKSGAAMKRAAEDLVKLLAPAAPAFCEELWERLGHADDGSIFNTAYPVCDEKKLVRDETEYAVQINSRIKCRMMIAHGLSEEEIRAAVCDNEEIRPLLEGKTVKKCIVVPGRLVNLIVG